ncbi:hypothetical protein [Larkinella terrae]|uniref:Uncharacterized protein n=1 Tax=Larkinella terrae TaxID=2025311 RepID=A0A7K0EL89_9BACT|nr:hypothetical protein [Larkinella terrae]MRS62554.1 hypothetical protein [Larkinella terrae]
MSDSSFKSVEIRYQTAQAVPPPYAHFFTITAHSAADNGLKIEVVMTYTDRDELDEEEITGEGFSINDDFDWSGKLLPVWTKTVGELIRRTQLKTFNEEKLNDNQDYFLVTIEGEKQSKSAGTPSHPTEWQFLSQELIQATYEVSGKEKPFEVTYVVIEAGNRTEAHLTASFSRREVRLEARKNNQSQSRTLPWKELTSMMEVFYAVDYLSEEALPDLPRKTGRYLNLGTPEWYETGTSIIGDESAVNKLRKLLNQLVQS